jgi:hypothetical protein
MLSSSPEEEKPIGKKIERVCGDGREQDASVTRLFLRRDYLFSISVESLHD